MTPFRPLHRLFLLDGRLEGLIDESNPRTFCEAYFGELLATIKMKPLAPLSVSPATDLEAPGFSAVQELTTSHTTFHYFWEPHGKNSNPNLHLDLYSCAPYDFGDIIRVANKHFGLAEWTANFVDRDMDPRKRLSLEIRGKGDTILEQVVLTSGKESRRPMRRSGGPRAPALIGR
jgi:hypothetical protein